MTDAHCTDCRSIGCECPHGYFGGGCSCDNCGHRWAIAAPVCVFPGVAGCPRAVDVRCPECRGALTADHE